MLKETYYCDIEKCRVEVKKDDLFNVTIQTAKAGYCSRRHTVQVCQTCALKVGLVKLDEQDHTPSIAPADALYDIVCDIISDANQDQRP